MDLDPLFLVIAKLHADTLFTKILRKGKRPPLKNFTNRVTFSFFHSSPRSGRDEGAADTTDALRAVSRPQGKSITAHNWECRAYEKSTHPATTECQENSGVLRLDRSSIVSAVWAIRQSQFGKTLQVSEVKELVASPSDITERAGFEPAVGTSPTQPFQGCSISHSDTSPIATVFCRRAGLIVAETVRNASGNGKNGCRTARAALLPCRFGGAGWNYARRSVGIVNRRSAKPDYTGRDGRLQRTTR